MLCREVVDVIERTYPKHAAETWDNVGLIAGRTEKEVKKIFVALDATEDVIEKAIQMGADMLITHHPLIFSPMKKITDEHFIGSRVVKLLQHDISYYAMHTNYDALGMAELSGKMLGLLEAEVLEVTDAERGEGYGRVGYLEQEMTLEACCERVKKCFGLSHVKLFGEREAVVRRAAILPGSGKDMIETALDKGAEVYITGDIDHHDGIDALARGLAIIDAGHYGLEHIFVADMAEYLQQNLEGIVVERAEVIHPFQVI